MDGGHWERERGRNRSCSQLEEERRTQPSQPQSLSCRPLLPLPSPSSVLSSLGPSVRPRWLSVLCQRELTHLIKVSNEELCIFLNYCLSLWGDGLKWDFSHFLI